MKLLIDANLSPRVATTLGERGYEATHVGEIGLLSASDTTIMSAAVQLGAAVATADTDFPMLLALAGHTRPSIVLLRRISGLSPAEQVSLLLECLPSVEPSITAGSIVTVSPERVRVHALPIN